MLIILMMVAPMRSVLAEQGSHCDMEDMSAMSQVSSHQVHLSQSDVDEPILADIHSQCCCCDGDSCAGSCDMGMAVSILMRDSIFRPVFTTASNATSYSPEILARALTPPTRPPLKLS